MISSDGFIEAAHRVPIAAYQQQLLVSLQRGAQRTGRGVSRDVHALWDLCRTPECRAYERCAVTLVKYNPRSRKRDAGGEHHVVCRDIAGRGGQLAALVSGNPSDSTLSFRMPPAARSSRARAVGTSIG